MQLKNIHQRYMLVLLLFSSERVVSTTDSAGVDGLNSNNKQFVKGNVKPAVEAADMAEKKANSNPDDAAAQEDAKKKKEHAEKLVNQAKEFLKSKMGIDDRQAKAGGTKESSPKTDSKAENKNSESTGSESAKQSVTNDSKARQTDTTKYNEANKHSDQVVDLSKVDLEGPPQTIPNKDGSVTNKFANGTESTVKQEGGRINAYDKDGKLYATAGPDGKWGDLPKEGLVTPDGLTHFPDGSKTFTANGPDGKQYAMQVGSSKDDVIARPFAVKENGEWKPLTQSQIDKAINDFGIVSERTAADGTRFGTKLNRDGSVSDYLKLNPDGKWESYTPKPLSETLPNGMKRGYAAQTPAVLDKVVSTVQNAAYGQAAASTELTRQAMTPTFSGFLSGLKNRIASRISHQKASEALSNAWSQTKPLVTQAATDAVKISPPTPWKYSNASGGGTYIDSQTGQWRSPSSAEAYIKVYHTVGNEINNFTPGKK